MGARPGPMLRGPRSPGQCGGGGGKEAGWSRGAGQGGALRALPGSAAAAQGRGRAMRKCQAGGRRSSGRAQLGPAARPLLPGAATRAHRRQVGPGRPRSSPRPPGTCRRREADWGRAGAREVSASGSAWSRGAGGGRWGSAPTAGRAPRVWRPPRCFPPPDQRGMPRAGSLRPAGARRAGRPGRRSGHQCQLCSSLPPSRQAVSRMGSARAPASGPAWLLERRTPIPPFCALRIPLLPAPLTFSVKRMRLKGLVFPGP